MNKSLRYGLPFPFAVIGAVLAAEAAYSKSDCWKWLLH